MKNLYSKILDMKNKYLEIWQKKKPGQKWKFIYDCAGILGDSIGVTVPSSMKINWYSYSSEGMALIYILMTLMTVWFHFKQGEYLRGLQPTCSVGIMFACITVQIQTLGPGRFRLNNLVNIGGKYIYMDEDETPKYRALRERLIAKLVRNTTVVIILIFIAFSMFGMIVFQHARITFLGIELPFFEEDSDIGFVVNFVMQTVLGLFVLVGCLTIEIGACLVNNIKFSMPHLVRIGIEDLNTEIMAYGMTLTAKVRLLNILMRVQDFQRCLLESIAVYYTRLFIGPFLFTYSISFAIFSILIIENFPGYGCAACNYLLLLICCHLGEVIEQARTQMSTELYNMSWYLLPASSQREVCTAIHMNENAKIFTIGPFSTLNLETAANLTKSIYRLTMFLYNSFN